MWLVSWRGIAAIWGGVLVLGLIAFVRATAPGRPYERSRAVMEHEMRELARQERLREIHRARRANRCVR